MRRLHPGSILAEFARQLPRILVFCLVIVIRMLTGTGEFGPLEWAFAASVAVLTLAPLLTYLTERYRLNPEGLEHHSGWLRRSRRTVVWEAVTATEVTEPLVYRLLGIKILTLSQGGDEATKITLQGISAAALSEIRAHLAGDRPGEASPVDAANLEVYRATPKELMVMAVVRGHMVVLGAAGLFSAYQLLDDTGLTERVEGSLTALPIVAVVGVLLIMAGLLGIVSTVVTYYEFTVQLVDGTLVFTYGLFNRKERRIDPAVVRGVVVERNLIEKFLGRARLGVLTRDSQVELATNTVLPTLPLGTVSHLARTHFPDFIGEELPVDSSPHLGRSLGWLALLLGLPGATVLVGHLAGQLPWGLGAAPVLFVLLLTVLRGLTASFQLAAAQGLVQVRRRFVGDRTVILRTSVVQIVTRVGRGRRYLAASLATFAGTPETYHWLRADRGQIESVSDACFNGCRDRIDSCGPRPGAAPGRYLPG